MSSDQTKDIESLEKQIRESGKASGATETEINNAVQNMKNSVKRGGKDTSQDDMIKNLMQQVPMLLSQFTQREKRCKLILELTTPELFKLSEFMMKENIGKTQIMEDP